MEILPLIIWNINIYDSAFYYFSTFIFTIEKDTEHSLKRCVSFNQKMRIFFIRDAYLFCRIKLINTNRTESVL